MSNTFTYTTNIERTNGTFTKTSDGDAWNSQLYTNEFFNGRCLLQFQASLADMVVGISGNPVVDNTFDSVDHGFFLNTTGDIVIVEEGVSIGTFGTFTAKTDFKIVYNGLRVFYYVDDTLLKTTDSSADINYWFNSFIYTEGGSIEDISFSFVEPVATDKALGRLAYQFSDRETVRGFIEAVSAEYDELYASEQDLLNERELDSAIGQQLDGIGEIVGVTRPIGTSDTDYYNILKTKIAINSTNMSVDSTLELFKFVFDADEVRYELPVNLSPIYTVVGDITEVQEFVFALLPTTLGIRATYTTTGDLSDTFSFDGAAEGKGFSSVSDTASGGKWASILIS